MFGFFKRKQRFTLDYLRFAYQTLEKHPIITPRNESSIIRTLKDVAEHMIYGDQHNNHLVLFLAEKNFLAFFLKLLRQNYSRDITVQLLQTLSIMVQNIEKQYGLYYLFSQNHINDIIVYDFDFSQPEVLNYYITFLKTISMKLNRDVIHFFFNSQAEDFPLYTEALKLYQHKETLVRTTVRALTLNVYKVEDSELRKFILKRSAVTYLTQAVWLMREQCLDMDKNIKVAEGKDKQIVISDGVEHQKDHYFYLEDMLKLGFPELHAIVSDQLLSHFLLPVLLGSVRNSDKGVSDDPYLISCKLSLFLLTQVCEIFRDPDLLNPLIVCLLHPHPPKLATQLTLSPVKVPVMAKPSVSEVLWKTKETTSDNQKVTEELSIGDTPLQSAAQVNSEVPPLPKSQPPEPPADSLESPNPPVEIKPNNPADYKPYPIAPYFDHLQPSGNAPDEPFLTLDESIQKPSVPASESQKSSVISNASELHSDIPSESLPVDIDIGKEDIPPAPLPVETIAVLRPQPQKKAELHGRLAEMGYSELTCKRALRATNYSGLSEAVGWLVAHPDMITQVDQNVLNPRSKLNKHVETVQPVTEESFEPQPSNPIRDKIMGFLSCDDEQLISCAASLVLIIIRNPDASKLLLKEIGLEPQSKRRKESSWEARDFSSATKKLPKLGFESVKVPDAKVIRAQSPMEPPKKVLRSAPVENLTTDVFVKPTEDRRKNRHNRKKRSGVALETSLKAGCAEEKKDNTGLTSESPSYSEVVDLCFKTLGRLSNLSIFTIRVLCDLITDLALVKPEQAASEDDEKEAKLEIPVGLTEEHNKRLQEIYDGAMTDLRACLPLPAKLEGFFLDTFFEEWRAFKTESNIKKLVEKPIRILPTSIFSHRNSTAKVSQDNSKTKGGSSLLKKRREKVTPGRVLKKKLKPTPGGASSRGQSPAAPPPPCNPPPVSEHMRLRKIIDRLRKTIQVLLQIGRLRERFAGLTQSFPFELQRNWRFYVSQRVPLDVLGDSIPVVQLQGTKKKEPLMASFQDIDYIVLWSATSKIIAGTKSCTQSTAEEAVVQLCFPVAHAEAQQHSTDKRVVHLILQHHRKPIESCVELPKQRNKWMLALYFNTQLNEPPRSNLEAEKDANRFVAFVTDNRNRKRAEMQLAIANLLGGDLSTAAASTKAVTKSSPNVEKLSINESKESPPTELQSKSNVLVYPLSDVVVDASGGTNSVSDRTQTSSGIDVQSSQPPRESEKERVLQPSPQLPVTSVLPVEQKVEAAIVPKEVKVEEPAKVPRVDDLEYWKQEEATIAGLIAPTYSKKKPTNKVSDNVAEDLLKVKVTDL